MSVKHFISINVSLLKKCLKHEELAQLNDEVMAFQKPSISAISAISDEKSAKSPAVKKTFNNAIEFIFQTKIITDKKINIRSENNNLEITSQDAFIQLDKTSDMIQRYNLTHLLNEKEFDREICLIYETSKFFIRSQKIDGHEFVNGTEIAAVLKMKSDDVVKRLAGFFLKDLKNRILVTASNVLINVHALHVFDIQQNPDKIAVLSNERFTITDKNEFTHGHASFAFSLFDLHKIENIFKAMGLEKVEDISQLGEVVELSKAKMCFLDAQKVLPSQNNGTLFALAMPSYQFSQPPPHFGLLPSQFQSPQPPQFTPPQASQFIPPQTSHFIAPAQY